MSAAPHLLSVLEAHGLDPATPPDPAAWQAFVAALSRAEADGDDLNLNPYKNPHEVAPAPGLAASAAQKIQAAAQSGEWYQQAVEISPNAIFLIDLEGRIRACNRACSKDFGYGDEVIGQNYSELLEVTSASFVEPLLPYVEQGEGFSDIELRYRARNGTAKRTTSRLYPYLDEGGAVIGYIFANTDVTSRLQIEAELAEQSANYQNILNSVPVEIVVFDAEHRYQFVNPSAVREQKLRHWLIGRDDFEYCAHLGHDLTLAETRREHFRRALTEKKKVQWEERFETPAGVRYHARNLCPVYGEQGEFVMMLGYGQDVTELTEAQRELQRAHGELERRVEERTRELAEAKGRLEKANEQLQHDAFHDALTGLPNRALFKDRLGQAVERFNRRLEGGFAVLFLDFDRFKVINDSLGHAVGDALLIALGERLKGCVRPADTVARLGGDEFTILLEDVSVEGAIQTAERIQTVLKRPFLLSGKQVPITVSIGIVPAAAGYDRAEDVLRDADLAMYRAKALGKAGYQVFTAELREHAVTLMALETDLRGALERRELEVHYQPIISVEKKQPIGFEALVRWQHPVHGLVSPQAFVPLAEELGLMAEIDLWVLREACTQLLTWQGAFPLDPPLTLSVNLSGQGFARPDLAAKVAQTLAQTGFAPESLKLELTESVLITHSGTVKETLEQLYQLGVQLHIDDFGTGYSSLSYLQNFPLNVLKIDRSFIQRMEGSVESTELVRTIVALARSLNLKVTAEGVETAAQLEQLRALGCEFGQGFLFAHPLSAAEAVRFMLEAGSAELVLSDWVTEAVSSPSD